MTRHARRNTLLALVACLMACTLAQAAARTPIYRCEQAGQVIFSDVVCAPGVQRVQSLDRHPSRSERAEAQELALREARWADGLRQERLQRQAADARLQRQLAQAGVAGVRLPPSTLSASRPAASATRVAKVPKVSLKP